MYPILINAFLAILGVSVLFCEVKTDKKITLFGHFFLAAFLFGLIANLVFGHLSEENSKQIRKIEQEKISKLQTQLAKQEAKLDQAAWEAQENTAQLNSTIKIQNDQLVEINKEFAELVKENAKLSQNYTALFGENQKLADDNIQLSKQIANLGGQISYQNDILRREAEKQTRLAEEQKRLTERELRRQERCRRSARFGLDRYDYNC